MHTFFRCPPMDQHRMVMDLPQSPVTAMTDTPGATVSRIMTSMSEPDQEHTSGETRTVTTEKTLECQISGSSKLCKT